MPLDPKDLAGAAEAAKGSWQWVVGGILSGIYGIWKYINRRFVRLEDSLVTSAQLREHTDTEEKKFDALFRLHGDLMARVISIGNDVSRIKGKMELSDD